MTSEQNLIARFLIEASRRGARMFRVNTAMGWAGKAVKFTKQQYVKVLAGDVLVSAGRPLHAGLCKGSSDTIGWTPVVVTPEMVGKTIAVFTAVEFKTDAAITTQEQIDFVKTVRAAGGLACISYDVEGPAEMLSGDVLRGKYIKAGSVLNDT